MNKLVLIMAPEDRAALERAHGYLEYPSLAARLSSALGAPIEQGLRMLPKSWHHAMQRKAERIFRNMLEVSIASLGENPKPVAKERLHKVLACGAGAVGGFFGLPALLVELPVTTSLMLRSIADVAHANGEDLRALETRLACLEVFALGGRAQSDDAAETGYYGLRVALAVQFSDVAARLAGSGPAAPRARSRVRSFGYEVQARSASTTRPTEVKPFSSSC